MEENRQILLSFFSQMKVKKETELLNEMGFLPTIET